MNLSLIFYSFIFLFGLSAGSFLNSIIYRLQTGESFLITRSYCPSCKKILSWQDLIPVLSFLFLKGKCRYCLQKISYQYPLVELSTGSLFALTFYTFSPLVLRDFFTIGYWLLAISFLIIIFVSDFKYYIIPDKIIYPAILIALLYNIFSLFAFRFSLNTFINLLFSAILASAFFLSIVLISKGRWMGWGDPKLAFFMGLLLGFPKIIVALFLAFFIGAIIGIGLIILKKKTLKSEIPFGPFLVTGIFIALFWSDKIINWYLNLFLNA